MGPADATHGTVKFSCILVPRALNITHVVVSSYIQERKEKSKVEVEKYENQTSGPGTRRVDYVIKRLIAENPYSDGQKSAMLVGREEKARPRGDRTRDIPNS